MSNTTTCVIITILAVLTLWNFYMIGEMVEIDKLIIDKIRY